VFSETRIELSACSDSLHASTSNSPAALLLCQTIDEQVKALYLKHGFAESRSIR
jgi:hypothetical protein